MLIAIYDAMIFYLLKAMKVHQFALPKSGGGGAF